jgi:hypothetical protein
VDRQPAPVLAGYLRAWRQHLLRRRSRDLHRRRALAGPPAPLRCHVSSQSRRAEGRPFHGRKREPAGGRCIGKKALERKSYRDGFDDAANGKSSVHRPEAGRCPTYASSTIDCIGKLRDVEEVQAPQVLVPFSVLRADGIGVNEDFDCARSRIFGCSDGSGHPVETSPNQACSGRLVTGRQVLGL